jgi:hypothetical protein
MTKGVLTRKGVSTRKGMLNGKGRVDKKRFVAVSRNDKRRVAVVGNCSGWSKQQKACQHKKACSGQSVIVVVGQNDKRRVDKKRPVAVGW